MGGATLAPRGTLLGLLLAGWLSLHGPKLLGYLEALLQPGKARLAGGRLALVRNVLAELAYTALLDPIIALHKSWAVLLLAAGHRAGWSGQSRHERRLSWAAATRVFWPHTVFGVVVLAAFMAISVFAGVLGGLFTAGLVLAVPFAVLTSRSEGGGR